MHFLDFCYMMALQSVLGQVLVRGVIKQASCSEKCYERACV